MKNQSTDNLIVIHRNLNGLQMQTNSSELFTALGDAKKLTAQKIYSAARVTVKAPPRYRTPQPVESEGWILTEKDPTATLYVRYAFAFKNEVSEKNREYFLDLWVQTFAQKHDLIFVTMLLNLWPAVVLEFMHNIPLLNTNEI